MLRLLVAAFVAWIPMTVLALAAPDNFPRNKPVAYNDFLSCKLASMAVGVVRRATDRVDAGARLNFTTEASDECTRYRAKAPLTAGNEIIVDATIGSYASVDSRGEVTYYIHSYRRENWSPGRYEYMITTVPMFDPED